MLQLMMNGVFSSRPIGFKDSFNFIPHLTENFQNFFLAAFSFGRVVKCPVLAIHLAREKRTRFVRVATNGYHRFNLLI